MDTQNTITPIIIINKQYLCKNILNLVGFYGNSIPGTYFMCSASNCRPVVFLATLSSFYSITSLAFSSSFYILISYVPSPELLAVFIFVNMRELFYI